MADASCIGGSVQCWIVSQAGLLNNIASTLAPVQKLITGGAYLMGIAFVIKGIFCLKQMSEQRTQMSSASNLKEPLLYIIVGSMLVYFPSSFAFVMQSTFGYQNVLQYGPVSGGNQAMDAIFGAGSVVGRPLCMFIQVIGLVAFVRGWVLIARSASQGQPPGGTGKGLMHVFGGVLAVNIVGTLNIINNTLYGS